MTIIALLAALLVPAIQNAVAQARLVACASNTRQIATGTFTYVSDHQGRLPLVISLGNLGTNMLQSRGARRRGKEHTISGMGLVWRGEYLRDPEVFYCPGAVAVECWGNRRPADRRRKMIERFDVWFGSNRSWPRVEYTLGWWGQDGGRADDPAYRQWPVPFDRGEPPTLANYQRHRDVLLGEEYSVFYTLYRQIPHGWRAFNFARADGSVFRVRDPNNPSPKPGSYPNMYTWPATPRPHWPFWEYLEERSSRRW